MNIEDYKGVFTFAQQVHGELSNVSLELIGKARDLAADLETNV
ncbi:MAG: electron transfer flavoprotein subunit alpha/FixB family protein, partial [Chloroflexi bacterium]|nr:electron transfer flavoprotein subunit alpha/FixB family protein [Chloroflexota bacterium]